MKKFIVSASLMLLMACSDNDDNDTVTPPPPPPVQEFSATKTFELMLSGKQEVPMNTSMQTASATVELDENLMQFRATLDYSDVEGFSAAHIHDGDLGANGDVAFAFEASDDNKVSIPITDLSEDLIEDMLDGDWYINLHTEAFPSGELRAQIVPDTVSVITFKLDGSQQVPMNESSAMGYGYASYDSTDGELYLRAVTMDVDDATAAHIHTGRIGMNGDVLVVLEQDDEVMTDWVTPDDTMIDEATLNVLLSGGHYVNVHTPELPNGEIRGQILTDNYAVATFDLSGKQEVPAVATMASGDGYALVNTDNYEVELRVVTSGVEDATAAHIHTGRIGMNGDVLVGLEQSTDDMNVWMTPDNTMINAEIFAVLASGGHYVNVHTPSNPSGELRGQILTSNYALATFALSGQQEVPAVSTMASGDGYALVNMNDYEVELRVVTIGVEDATAAHIHTGRIGMNGDVLVGLEQSTDDMNVWMTPDNTMINAEIFAVLASGGHYVNVHTPSNPSGELRGQILTSNYALATFALSGQQEVPAVSTMASGDGYALVNMNDYEVELRVVTMGVEDATAAHIHTGRIGMNGDVLVGLEQSTDDMNVWMTPDNTMINAEIFAVLASGGHYVNVHTPASASGELRGQILTDNYTLVAFPLSGEQEVPAVTTTATGSGYALVNRNGFDLELQVLTSGVADATAAHIHTGIAGKNGPVLLALMQDSSDANRWMAPANAALTAEIFAILAGGGHYVNVHTPANPSGELRGQIVN
ncbi:CHRD domain-containing protein [Pseudoalteromonas maricaloris]|uniref:CHRD domain-containing protein n=1 Tax=Pseudoalteromonas maricaloris TaxID=184924 RepID=UPI0021ADA379|nr:CHRD domain-containing protein [Pseudoalteromonas flavipulchra]USE71147.1 CHRD domain-containing protein [Pseudoalteromonas flavipulchra]